MDPPASPLSPPSVSFPKLQTDPTTATHTKESYQPQRKRRDNRSRSVRDDQTGAILSGENGVAAEHGGGEGFARGTGRR